MKKRNIKHECSIIICTFPGEACRLRINSRLKKNFSSLIEAEHQALKGSWGTWINMV